MAVVRSPERSRLNDLIVENVLILEDFYDTRKEFTLNLLANMRRTGRGCELSKTGSEKGALSNTGSNIVYRCSCGFQLLARISKSLHHPGRIELLRDHEEFNLRHANLCISSPPNPQREEMLADEEFLL
jgi:hypothetical protein